MWDHRDRRAHNIDALLGQLLGSRLGSVSSDTAKRVLVAERRCLEDRADHTASLVAGGTEDGQKLLGRGHGFEGIGGLEQS